MVEKKGCITKERKEALLARLGRIKGQVGGLEKMVDEGRYCVDIMQQLSAVHQALRGAGKIIMKNYLEICASDAIKSKKKERREKIYQELMDVIYKFAK